MDDAGKENKNVGRIISAKIERPGRAALIAKNGWPCAHDGMCMNPVTVEVVFQRIQRGGGTVSCSHGVCDKHAIPHRKFLLRLAAKARKTEDHAHV